MNICEGKNNKLKNTNLHINIENTIVLVLQDVSKVSLSQSFLLKNNTLEFVKMLCDHNRKT